MKIEQFQNQFRWLSNFWFCPVKFDGIEYPTVEHAYQASKCLNSTDRQRISELESPGQVKRFGKNVKLRNDWEQVKVSIMKDLLREKFKNSYLRQKLIATRDSVIEEGNYWHDKFWGICPPGSGDGQNILGKLIMEVREEIKKEAI